jgi:hypothetical protein
VRVNARKKFRIETVAFELEHNRLRFQAFWTTECIPCMQLNVPEIEIKYYRLMNIIYIYLFFLS